MLRMTAATALIFSASMVGAQTLSTFGTPGLVDLPTAEVFDDGEVGLTVSGFGANVRSTLAFQVLPRVYGTFRYSFIDNFDAGGSAPDRYDRSFDLHYQITNETETRPGLAVGLRDFGGTGIYSGEYVVATKRFGERSPGVWDGGALHSADHSITHSVLSMTVLRHVPEPAKGALAQRAN